MSGAWTEVIALFERHPKMRWLFASTLTGLGGACLFHYLNGTRASDVEKRMTDLEYKNYVRDDKDLKFKILLQELKEWKMGLRRLEQMKADDGEILKAVKILIAEAEKREKEMDD